MSSAGLSRSARARAARWSTILLLTLAAGLLAPVANAAAAPPLAAERGVLAATEPLQPGTNAVVKTDTGDCLRLRGAPSLNGERLACIPQGSVVSVLPGLAEADGYRWQLVLWRDLPGWAADEYLQPSTASADTAVCGASAFKAGFTGGLPLQGGLGLVGWGGGTVNGVHNAAAAEGCRLIGIWAFVQGKAVGYRFGVPDFVNVEWNARFPGGALPAGTSLLVMCHPPGADSASVAAVTLPASAPPLRVNAAQPLSVSATAAIVIDERSGAVLFEKNAHTPLPPASLTKIATAIVALEGATTSAWVQVDVDHRKMPGSSVMGLVPGDCFTMNDLLYGLMLPSGNDAALAIGRYIAGSDAAFVNQMNTLLARLGLTESRFTDPHGLGSANHRASAHDLAMLSRYAMSVLPGFRDIVTASSFTAQGKRNLTMRNVNGFLGSYALADGIKTGFTEQAGRTLIASASRDGQRVIVVVLNAPNRVIDAERLMDWAFATHQW